MKNATICSYQFFVLIVELLLEHLTSLPGGLQICGGLGVIGFQLLDMSLALLQLLLEIATPSLRNLEIALASSKIGFGLGGPVLGLLQSL